MTKPSSNAVRDVGFGAISITGAEIKSSEINGTLDALTWGEIRQDDGKGKADLTIEDANFTIPGKNGAKDMTIDFDGMSARNLHIGSKNKAGIGQASEKMVSSILGSLNNFEKPYDELVVESLKINTESFDVDFGGMEGKTTEKGEIITTRQSLKPTVINLKPALGETPQFKEQFELIKSLGMETIHLSGSSVSTLNSKDDSMAVSDGLFVMDDVFRLNFEYEAEGLNAMIQKLKSVKGKPSNTSALAAYETLKLRDFRLTLEDNSIVEKGLTVATEMTGQSEKNIKRMLSGAVFAVALAAENEIQADVYSKAVEAFADFVKNGGTLTLEANPPEPFSLAPFVSGKGDGIDPDSLGFSASQSNGSK